MPREERRRRYIRFLGVDWEPRELIIFFIGIALFILGVVLMWLFSPLELDMTNMLVAIIGIFIGAGQYLVSASKGFIVRDVVSRLDRQGEILERHTEILNQHTKILNEHTRILSEHTKILSEHTMLLNEIISVLREVRDLLSRRG